MFFVSYNAYEKFRLTLTMNLCKVLPADQLAAALEAVDVTMDDYEIARKRMELITADGVPEVVKMFIAAKHVAHRSTGTLKQYRYRLSHFFDTVRKSYMDVTANDIRMYLYKVKQDSNASDHYLDTIRIILNTFFHWLVDNDYLLKSPCVKVEKISYNNKHREPLTMVQLETMRWNVKDIREKALIDFFFATGCRVAECAAVKLSDIDWQNKAVVIRHGKGDKTRTVYFNAEAYVSMQKYLAARSDDIDALFVSARKPIHAVDTHALENVIRKVAERSGLHVFPHRIRTTFATAGIRRGMSLHTLQLLMGHADPKTTLIYAQQAEEEVKHEHQRIYA